MSKKIDRQIEKLQELRLPELQARFAEIVGEPTRAPNKKYLLRRIREALEAKAQRGGTSDSADAPATKRKREPSGLTKLTVEELQQRYLQEVGRPTESDNRAYLIWKLRQARKGKIRIGPARERKHEPGTTQVVPLTLPRESVAALDEVVGRTSFINRSAFLRRAIHDLLEHQGFASVATEHFGDA